jgi:hypothetical protein
MLAPIQLIHVSGVDRIPIVCVNAIVPGSQTSRGCCWLSSFPAVVVLEGPYRAHQPVQKAVAVSRG